MSAALSPDLIDRLVKIIVMFSSTNDGDIIVAGRALQRQLASAYTDIHALAAHLRAGGGLRRSYSKTDTEGRPRPIERSL